VGVQRELYFSVRHLIIQKPLNQILSLPFVVSGRGQAEVGSLKRLRWKELKLRIKGNKRVPHPILNHRALSQPLLYNEGSAICD
jgi:hypothetical protein